MPADKEGGHTCDEQQQNENPHDKAMMGQIIMIIEMIIIIVIMIIMMIPMLPSKCERAHLENGTGVKISRRLARHTGILFYRHPAGNEILEFAVEW